MKTLNLRITIRLEQRQRLQIEKAVSQGRGESISDLTRTALSEFLEQIEVNGC